MFPELRPHLEECFDLAEPGTEYVITRETELADDFPMHVVCQWIGNSQPELAAQEKTPVLQGSAAECDVVPVVLVPPEGLEPSTY